MPAVETIDRTLDELERASSLDGFAPEDAVALVDAADALLLDGGGTAETFSRYLEVTRKTPFLMRLPDPETRTRWAETTLGAIRKSRYTLASMLADRVRLHPDRILFKSPETAGSWTYRQVSRRIEEIAGFFYDIADGNPRVAFVMENNLEGALCDLACLTHDILVSPLAPHLDADALHRILTRLDINIVVTDSDETLHRLKTVSAKLGRPLQLVVVDSADELARGGIRALGDGCARLGHATVERRLAARRRFALDEIATVLFTSGSTGEQKGVAFSLFNLVSKRFCRAAALPFVGEGELLVAYLPLYHTFGRYLEMLGMLYWGGTYVFSGNPSVESLLKGLSDHQPTGMISIPIRWRQLRDECLKRMDGAGSPEAGLTAFRQVVGGRLSWGLSAAGALEPSVFRFFEKHGVALCSGFGMTEATGGIMMTPPMKYEDNSVGFPLPGMKVRLTEEGELEIAGAYVARYLDSDTADGEEAWIPTGDIFRQRPSGHYEIIDRVKDIYKNSRGRTVAPRRVEQKFDGVPGIKRVFLAGDGRDDNVLLIVPDAVDPVLGGQPESEAAREYFERIVAAANEDLASYERVVNFTVLKRDLELDLGELTPKGSYRRKVIEKNFGEEIKSLYRSKEARITASGVTFRVPRWLFRDLGILEGDLVPGPGGLRDRRRNKSLLVAPSSDRNYLRIGALEYCAGGAEVDLGLFARHPLLWLGNDPLAGFLSVKDGWDVSLGTVSPEVRLPQYSPLVPGVEALGKAPSPRLASLHRLFLEALFGTPEQSLEALDHLGGILKDEDRRAGSAIRRRLQALSRHPEVKVRAKAYEILLLDQPVRETDELLSSFVRSGKSFLTEQSIEKIANADLEREQLSALRRRLAVYRHELKAPVPASASAVLDSVLTLLVTFVEHHPDYYGSVRAELAAWALQQADAVLARRSEVLHETLARWFEGWLASRSEVLSRRELAPKVALAEGISEEEARRLLAVLADTVFLRESVLLAFEGEDLDLKDVPDRGIWVVPLQAHHDYRLYRVAINTWAKKHFDLLLVLRPDLDRGAVRATNFWMMVLASAPGSAHRLPAFGCSRPELGALSLAYVTDLTVAERLRDEAARLRSAEKGPAEKHVWENQFVRALACFFSLWKASGERIVPGSLSPANVVVPVESFREGGAILSLSGWTPFQGLRAFVEAIERSFFEEVEALYPSLRGRLDRAWIFEACLEALGREAVPLLQRLRSELPAGSPLEELLSGFVGTLERGFHAPLDLRAAVAHYLEWEARHPRTPAQARADAVEQVYSLYRLDLHPDLVRYQLYRKTYFRDADAAVLKAFDAVLAAIESGAGARPATLVELFDLQSALTEDFDRLVFSRLVFPGARFESPVEVQVVSEGLRHVVFQTQIQDRLGATYLVREPVEPAEIGHFYRMSLRAGVPRALSERHRYLMVLDGAERVVGGISYLFEEKKVVRLEGIVVAPSLRNRGLSQAFLNDFCARMRGQKVEAVTTSFALASVPFPGKFQFDVRWGGMVCSLVEDEPEPEPLPLAPVLEGSGAPDGDRD